MEKGRQNVEGKLHKDMKILKEKVRHVGQWNMLEDDAGDDGDGDVEIRVLER